MRGRITGTGSYVPAKTLTNADLENMVATSDQWITERTGIPRQHIVLDPGIGFFRRPEIAWHEWDRVVLRDLVHLRELGFPLLVGVSRKSFIGKILNQPNAADRLVGSLSCAAIAVYNGAHIIRAHDVRETVEAVRMAEWLRQAPEGEEK